MSGVPVGVTDRLPVGAVPEDGEATPRALPTDRLRVLLHLAAELPLVVFGIAEMTHGWRPLWDNAETAWRSFQVLTAHSPLVGHQVALPTPGPAVFGPGPLENWLLAVPVRLDPGQGALWGAVIVAVVAVAFAIEAAWSVTRWWGATVVAGSVLLLFAARADVLVDVVWNAWFGIIFIYPTLASGVAVAAGRLRWWPVTVVAASVVAQSQEVFAIPVLLVCLVAPVVGVLARRPRVPAAWGWLVGGIGAGVVVWIAPLVQEIADSPGNLTLLWRAARQPVATVGLSKALAGLDGAISVFPRWFKAPPLHSAIGTFYYSYWLLWSARWWAVLALVVLAVATVVALRTGRTTLAGASVVSFVAAVGSVVALSDIPASQILNIEYLGVLLIPVGTAVVVTLVWIAVEGARAGLDRLRRTGSMGRLPTGMGLSPSTGRVLARGAGAAAITVLFLLSLRSGSQLFGTSSATVGGWPAIRAADTGAVAVARVAPRGPFRLRLAEPTTDYRFAVITGVAYQLEIRGLQPRFDGDGLLAFGAARPGLPVVTISVPAVGHDVTARPGEGPAPGR